MVRRSDASVDSRRSLSRSSARRRHAEPGRDARPLVTLVASQVRIAANTVHPRAPVAIVPPKSTHVQTNVNAVGRVNCSYLPASGLLLDVRLQKRSGSGSWTTQSTTTTILADTPTFARTSEAMPCVDGTFRTQARVWASGPRGQAAIWSLWATGYSVTITCGVGGGSGSW